MTSSMDQVLQARLDQRQIDNLYRRRHLLQSAQNSIVQVDGKTCVAFCSNDYLGLASHPAVIDSMRRGVETYGVGSGASHLVYGHSQEHHALEEELAAFTGRPRALLFSTGYMANLGAIRALVDKGDHVYQDRLNHASLLDGGLASNAPCQRYRHADVGDLTRRLGKAEKGRKLVVTDGVFSMDGDLAPLPALARACAEQDGWLMVDDAHGFGVLGKNGGGLAEHYGLGVTDVPVLVGTLGKAFGTFGAFVAGSDALIETLIQYARTYIYTTALPPSVAAATRISLKILRRETWRREKLVSLIERFRAGIDELGLELLNSPTPIQPVLLHDDALCYRVGEGLRARGFLVGAIRSPTVPVGRARLRITLCAEHTDDQVDALVESIGKTVAEVGKIHSE
ncbi:8-amino-7-oxononanoate synthase [Porticoccus sp.]|uniref:8-amino-7-oxononanoate synthase n=1 Tax=Porticoccus sp. TaxID=2024853 RepID=UPI003F697EDB